MSFGSEFRVFGSEVSRGRFRSKLRVVVGGEDVGAEAVKVSTQTNKNQTLRSKVCFVFARTTKDVSDYSLKS